MRVAFVCTENPEDMSTWSGTPYFMLTELRRQGAEVEVIAPLKRSFKYLFLPQKIASKLTGRNLQIDRHPVALRSFAKQLDRRIGNGKFDIIFSPSSIPISYLKAGPPVIFWTDAVIDEMVDYYGGSFANIGLRELNIAREQEQAAINRASFAIYSSKWSAEAARQRYDASIDKVRVIEFGANLRVNHDAEKVEQYIEARLRSECVLLFIGVDWERKGGNIAFEAARLLNERGIKTVLKVVGGDGPDATFVQKLGFIDKNTSEGQQQIKRLLETSTYFILPTRAEASAIVYCEASAFGLPILSTKTGGVENYVRDGETGYCLPLTATGSQYAEIIAKTHSSPDTYRRLSVGAFQRYTQKLNWDVAISSLLSLAEEAIAESVQQ